MIVYNDEWTLIVNLGGTAEVKAFVPFFIEGMKAFFILFNFI